MSKQEPEIPLCQTVDNEIDLVDIFLIIWKRKKMIIIFMFLCLLLGGGYSLYKSEQYKYITTFQIGTLIDVKGEQIQKSSIESAEIVKVKFDSVYIPKATKKFMDSNGGRRLKAESNIQKDSNIIVVKSNGELADEDVLRSFHLQIVAPILADHQQITSASMREFLLQVDSLRLNLEKLKNPQIYLFGEKVLQNEIMKAQANLSELDDKKGLLESQKRRLLETQNIVRGQLKKVEKNLELTYAERLQAKDEVADETMALTFLMVDNQIERSERRLADLKERAQVKIEDRKQVLANQLIENRRQYDRQKEKISELQIKLKKIRAERTSDIQLQKNVIAKAENKIDLYLNSRILGAAQRSVAPEGAGKSLILALAGILGLMGGIMLAFIAEFMTKVRQQQQAAGDG